MTDNTNPKDLIGAKKISMTALPPIAVAHGNHAMMDGARKYSPYNWRDKKVQAGIYVDAAIRHLLAWFDREETAEDSGVHHLGHAIACCGILLDAQASDCLIDNRPSHSGAYNKRVAELNDTIKKRDDSQTASPTEVETRRVANSSISSLASPKTVWWHDAQPAYELGTDPNGNGIIFRSSESNGGPVGAVEWLSSEGIPMAADSGDVEPQESNEGGAVLG